MVTHERLRQILHYDPDTGIFTWLATTSPTACAGKKAGCLRKIGYVYVCIEGKQYRANRLAWFYMTSVWPIRFVDHRNRVKSDNRWDNLREADDSQNAVNVSPRRIAKSGARGVTQDHNRFRARISVRGRILLLGSYPTLDEASAAYKAATLKHFGEFAHA